MSQPVLNDLTNQPSYRVQVVEKLACFRREWQQLAEGKSLTEVEASVGLMLADITDWLGLNPQERHAVLGGHLITQVDRHMAERVEARLPV